MPVFGRLRAWLRQAIPSPLDFFSNLKKNAGWESLRSLTIPAAAVSLLADFFKPINWMIPYVVSVGLMALVVFTLIYLRRLSSPTKAPVQMAARALLSVMIIVGAFGSIFVAQRAVAKPGGNLTERVLEALLDVQKSLQSIDTKVADVGRETTKTRVLMETQAAYAAMERAQQKADYADYNQVAALESLAASGLKFTRWDLTGVSLEDLQLPGGNFSGSRLFGVRLNNANLHKADLTGAHLSYSFLSKADFSGGLLPGARFVLADGEGANFSGAKLDGADFSAANLAGANFRGASLRRARFPFANLANADFSGADLTEAVMVRASMAGAKFDRTTFDTTDVTGATRLPAFKESDHAKLCRTGRGGTLSMHVTLIEMIPSSKYDSGTSYQRVFERLMGYEMNGSANLSECKPRDYLREWRFPVYVINGTEELATDFTIHASQNFLSKGERRGIIISRLKQRFFLRDP